MAGFQVGQRVMVVDYPTTAVQDLVGCYGHVARVYPHYDISTRTMVDVALKGRIAAKPWPRGLDPDGANQWIFFEHEIEAAD